MQFNDRPAGNCAITKVKSGRLLRWREFVETELNGGDVTLIPSRSIVDSDLKIDELFLERSRITRFLEFIFMENFNFFSH